MADNSNFEIGIKLLGTLHGPVDKPILARPKPPPENLPPAVVQDAEPAKVRVPELTMKGTVSRIVYGKFIFERYASDWEIIVSSPGAVWTNDLTHIIKTDRPRTGLKLDYFENPNEKIKRGTPERVIAYSPRLGYFLEMFRMAEGYDNPNQRSTNRPYDHSIISLFGPNIVETLYRDGYAFFPVLPDGKPSGHIVGDQKINPTKSAVIHEAGIPLSDGRSTSWFDNTSHLSEKALQTLAQVYLKLRTGKTRVIMTAVDPSDFQQDLQIEDRVLFAKL